MILLVNSIKEERFYTECNTILHAASVTVVTLNSGVSEPEGITPE